MNQLESQSAHQVNNLISFLTDVCIRRSFSKGDAVLHTAIHKVVPADQGAAAHKSMAILFHSKKAKNHKLFAFKRNFLTAFGTI